MNQIIAFSIRESFSTVKDQFIQKSREFGSRLVVYLQDPRFASAALFAGNFVIVEAANQIGNVVEFLFSEATPAKRNLKLIVVIPIKLIVVIPIKLGIIAAANYAVVRAAGINLHPVVVGEVVTVSIAVRWQAQKCLEK